MYCTSTFWIDDVRPFRKLYIPLVADWLALKVTDSDFGSL